MTRAHVRASPFAGSIVNVLDGCTSRLLNAVPSKRNLQCPPRTLRPLVILNYSFELFDDSCTYTYINADSVTSQRQHNWVEDPRVVDIEDVRGSVDQYPLDSARFQYGKQTSTHTCLPDDEEIKQEYYIIPSISSLSKNHWCE